GLAQRRPHGEDAHVDRLDAEALRDRADEHLRGRLHDLALVAREPLAQDVHHGPERVRRGQNDPRDRVAAVVDRALAAREAVVVREGHRSHDTLAFPMTAPGLAFAGALFLLPSLAAAAPEPDPRIAKLLAEVSPTRLEATLRRLESFQTRHTLSSPDTPGRGVGAAREWILSEMKSYSPRLQVSFDTYRIPKQGERVTREVVLRNVMAVLPGRTPRRFYGSGHYDTVARLPRSASPSPSASASPSASPSPGQSASGAFDWTVTDNVAPGVNDDGSGTALAMELARVFAQSGLEFDA